MKNSVSEKKKKVSMQINAKDLMKLLEVCGNISQTQSATYNPKVLDKNGKTTIEITA